MPPRPTETPTAVPTPPTSDLVEIPPLFRDFVSDMHNALERRDLAFFNERPETERRVCGERDATLRWPGDGCILGEEYDGLEVWYWRTDDAGRIPLETVMGMIEQLWTDSVAGASDEFGEADAAVYAVGGSAIPAGEYTAVLTAIIERPANLAAPGASGPLRVSLVTHWEERDGGWRFTALLNAFILGEDLLQAGTGWIPPASASLPDCAAHSKLPRG